VDGEFRHGSAQHKEWFEVELKSKAGFGGEQKALYTIGGRSKEMLLRSESDNVHDRPGDKPAAESGLTSLRDRNFQKKIF